MVALAASVDGTTLALQRSVTQVQFLQRVGPQVMFVQAPHSRSPLLGFFWTRSGGGDFVMVTRTGMPFFVAAGLLLLLSSWRPSPLY